MKGMYRNKKSTINDLGKIEEAKCCKPKVQEGGWGTCYNLNVHSSFDKKGWSKCRIGYYMTGLYRDSCGFLYCLDEFKCCKMGLSRAPGTPTKAPTVSPTKAQTTSPTKSPTIKTLPKNHTNDWKECFDDEGWCTVHGFMTGMWRNSLGGWNSTDGIDRIDEVSSADAPDYLHSESTCYNADWHHSLKKKGWSLCNDGYYMKGMYRSEKSKGNSLKEIKEAKCCRPLLQEGGWGTCYYLNVWASFDKKGWSKCGTGYYMTGLFRSKCSNLYCLEEFKCCKMGSKLMKD
jgi:hypothetical protein